NRIAPRVRRLRRHGAVAIDVARAPQRVDEIRRPRVRDARRDEERHGPLNGRPRQPPCGARRPPMMTAKERHECSLLGARARKIADLQRAVLERLYSPQTWSAAAVF